MKRRLTLAAAFVLMASGAFAQDFEGGYVGGLLGYASGSADTKLKIPVRNARLVATDDIDYDGWDLGAYGGYRFALGSGAMLGIEAGGAFSGAEGSTRDVYGARDINQKLEKKSELYLSFKAGIPVQNTAFVYGIAGAQFARFDALTQDKDGGGTIGSKDATVGGWNLGLGAEYFVTPVVSTRLEYKYQSYSSFSFANKGGGRSTVDPAENVFRLGVSYNF
jgi:opacity protein-like surface antigen